ncbi:hypothetical protein ACLB2K_014870 [Fragaria x ananassa]
MLVKLRKEEVRVLLKQLVKDCDCGTYGWAKVALRDRLKNLSFNVMMQMIAGKRYYSEDEADQKARRFREMIEELKQIHESFSNLNDFFPVLQLVDFQGVEKRMMVLMKKMDGFFQSLIDEQRRMRSDGACSEEKPTLIDIMLSLQQQDPQFYTDQQDHESCCNSKYMHIFFSFEIMCVLVVVW